MRSNAEPLVSSFPAIELHCSLTNVEGMKRYQDHREISIKSSTFTGTKRFALVAISSEYTSIDRCLHVVAHCMSQ